MKNKRENSIYLSSFMYNTVLLLYCFCKTPAVTPFVMAVVPWRLCPRQPQEGVNFLKT